MRLRKKMAKKLSIIFMALWLTGCAPFTENNIIEELTPVTFLSLSKGDEGKIKISTILPSLSKEKKSVITQEVSLIKEVLRSFNLNFYQEMKFGQMRMLIINEDLGRNEGIMSIINVLLTDPDISLRIYLVIVKGNFEEYLENQLDKQENLDYSFYRMLKHYEEKNQGELSVVNLHEFKKLLYTPYSDPFLPVFKIENDAISYEGTALFQNDKLVEIITTYDDRIFQLLHNDHYLAVLPIPELQVVLGHVRSKTKVDINKSLSTMTYTVNIDSRIEEYRGEKQLFDPKDLEVFKKDIQSNLEKQTQELVKKMQELNVDPLQLGIHTLKPFSKPMDEKKWIELFKKMDIKIKYNINITPLTDANSKRQNL
ncbi:spore gernimation protein [Sporosarcina sp. P21c]|uniref:Ger(x)C family spore germination protein n=1 Tax=unclassified Sporosarcina TaxID=2647733 RepID=UPI000C172362|nr:MULTISPECIES: Ger(x)C family spore germination protein [unclassified Sporosarcina]PIC67286.1 spore gernimation protein [Sporosarcina sp. P16a]PIC90230.1 spore gernimation protein [Sporosarcina sp. P21c]PIC92738.1 spore gernimation protein [Sporosarcina sp. P25]